MADALRKKWSMPEQARVDSKAPSLAQHRIRLVDGTMVSEPGDTGSQWRLHYTIGLPHLRCEEVIMTTQKEGETLKRFSIQKDDLLIGDRGFAHPAGIAHVVSGSGDVIIRTNLVTLPLYDMQEQRLSALTHLRSLSVGECADWPVQIKHDKRFIAGRLCGLKKSEVAAQKARERVKRESQRNGTQLQPETLEAADYVFVFTTLDARTDAATVMEHYRGRWQIELAFKRLKSLIQLGHLKKHDEIAARAWLQGKLLVALLVDALLLTAERISPWGYVHTKNKTQPMSLAGDLAHA
jgi:hypothetical protein